MQLILNRIALFMVRNLLDKHQQILKIADYNNVIYIISSSPFPFARALRRHNLFIEA